MKKKEIIEFRVLTEKDLNACTAAFIEIFNEEPWYDQWTFERASQYITDFYNTPHFLGILAIEKKQQVFAYGVIRTQQQGNEFYINEMGVKKKQRRQGIGKKLLEQLIMELEGAKITNFALLTDRGVPAEEFYKKNGFQEIERLVFYSREL